MERVVLGDSDYELRQLILDDVDEWLAGEDDEQVRWFEFPHGAERADVVRAIERWSASWDAGGPAYQWAIVERRSGELAGGAELRVIDSVSANFSYVVFPAWRRRGIATKAAGLVLDHARSLLPQRTVVLEILDGNVASLAVARRLGAEFVGTAPSEAGGTFLRHHIDLDRDSWNEAMD